MNIINLSDINLLFMALIYMVSFCPLHKLKNIYDKYSCVFKIVNIVRTKIKILDLIFKIPLNVYQIKQDKNFSYEFKTIQSKLITYIFILSILSLFNIMLKTDFEALYWLVKIAFISVIILIIVFALKKFALIFYVLFLSDNKFFILRLLCCLNIFSLTTGTVVDGYYNNDKLSSVSLIFVLLCFVIIWQLFYQMLKVIKSKNLYVSDVYKLFSVMVILMLMSSANLLSVTYDVANINGFENKMEYFDLFYYVSSVFFGFSSPYSATNKWTQFITIVIAFSAFMSISIMLVYVLNYAQNKNEKNICKITKTDTENNINSYEELENKAIEIHKKFDDKCKELESVEKQLNDMKTTIETLKDKDVPILQGVQHVYSSLSEQKEKLQNEHKILQEKTISIDIIKSNVDLILNAEKTHEKHKENEL